MKKNNHKYVLKIVALTAVIVYSSFLAFGYLLNKVNGQSNSAGVGYGAISTDQSNDIGIGSSTLPGTKLYIVGSTTDSSAYGLIIKNSNGVPTLTVANDGSVTAGSLTVGGTIKSTLGGIMFPDGTTQTTAASNVNNPITTANNVSSGAFGANTGGGNYSFPGNVGIGTTAPAQKLDVNGNINTSGGYYIGNSLFANSFGNGNTAIGIGAFGAGTNTGNYNTANGYSSLYSNTTGSNNTANGFYSLYSNTTGNYNTANGFYSLSSNITGNYNTANGYESLHSNTTGGSNTANGYASLYSNTTGGSNTANGVYSLYSNTTGNYNTANGFYSLSNNTTGSNNTANGYASLSNNTTGINNTANGYESLSFNITGSNNTANGMYSLHYNTTGNYNTANGYASLYSNTTGNQNTANGMQALYSNTTGSNNTANGFYSLSSNTTGNSNTANGYESLSSNTTGSQNTANGMLSLDTNNTGNNNTANGYESLQNNTNGSQNTAYGEQSLRNNTTGNSNTANGYQALYSNTTGNSNTANGYYSLVFNNIGSNNISNGYQAGMYIADGTTANTNSNNSIFLGAYTKALTANDTNEIVLGYNSTGLGTNSMVLGDSSIATTTIYGNVGIGTTTPAYPLDVNGKIRSITGGYVFPDGTIQTTAAGASGQVTSANNVSSGAFGANTGGGNYSFPGNVGIGTTAPSSLLTVNGLLTAGKFHYNVLSYMSNVTPTNGYSITTNIPFQNSVEMPNIEITGYAYGSQVPVKLNIVWYVYNGGFTSYGYTNTGGWDPGIVTLSVNSSNNVVIHLNTNTYYSRFGISAYANMSEQDSWFTGWSVADAIAPTTDLVTVSRKPLITDISGNSATTNAVAGTTNYIPVFTASNIIGNSVIYQSGGNVGIGTTAPGYKLDIVGAINSSNKITAAESTGSVNGGYSFTQDGGQDTGMFSPADGIISFYNNSSERVRINAIGNVGIGTTTPAYPLDVNGKIRSITGGYVFPDGTIQTTAAGASGQVTSANNVSSGAFGANTGGGNYSFAGNVGIGTTAPATALDVTGPADIRLGLAVGTTTPISTTGNGLFTGVLTVNNGIITNGITTNGIKMTNLPNTGYVLTSDASGNGTWQPTGVKYGNYTPTIWNPLGETFYTNQVYYSKVGSIVTINWDANFKGWSGYSSGSYLYFNLPFYLATDQLIGGGGYSNVPANQCIFIDQTNGSHNVTANLYTNNGDTVDIYMNILSTIYGSDLYNISCTYTYVTSQN